GLEPLARRLHAEDFSRAQDGPERDAGEDRRDQERLAVIVTVFVDEPHVAAPPREKREAGTLRVRALGGGEIVVGARPTRASPLAVRRVELHAEEARRVRAHRLDVERRTRALIEDEQRHFFGDGESALPKPFMNSPSVPMPMPPSAQPAAALQVWLSLMHWRE